MKLQGEDRQFHGNASIFYISIILKLNYIVVCYYYSFSIYLLKILSRKIKKIIKLKNK
jgi:hypothetical protein